MSRLLKQVRALGNLIPIKYLAGVAVAGIIAVAGWMYVLYDRIDTMQDKLDRANRQAGQYELALQDKEMDVVKLRDTIEMQNLAIRDLAEQRRQVEQRAAAQAELIASLKTPPAGDGAEAMQEWWDENVANR